MITAPLLALALVLRPEHPADHQDLVARLAGRLGFDAVCLPAAGGPAGPDRVQRLSAAAAPATVELIPDLTAAAEGTGAGTVVARAEFADALTAVRAANERPVTVVVPVAIGRTINEATARASRDTMLVDSLDPRRAGLFGTLEQAQQQVLALAAAGADALRVVLADEADLADLLAQVRSLVVGPTPVLHAGRATADPTR